MDFSYPCYGLLGLPISLVCILVVSLHQHLRHAALSDSPKVKFDLNIVLTLL